MTTPDAMKQAGMRLLDLYTGTVLTQMIAIGDLTGLFERLAEGAATSEALSRKSGLSERYVREWLGAVTTGGLVDYEPETEQYALRPEYAPLLTGTTARNAAPMGRLINHLGSLVPLLADRFHDGNGIPYAAYQPDFTEAMDAFWHRIYDEQLVDGFLGQFPALTAALERGIRVLDIGCGTGRALNVLASRYPRSTFVGLDVDAEAINKARDDSLGRGVSNTAFEVRDVGELPSDPRFGLIMAFDTVHHLPDPAVALERIRSALDPEGRFLMVEFRSHSTVDGNVGNPFAPLYYGVSLLHCVPVSLATGGPGLGAMWGEEVTRRMLGEAGFTDVSIVDTPRPQNYMFVCRS